MFSVLFCNALEVIPRWGEALDCYYEGAAVARRWHGRLQTAVFTDPLDMKPPELAEKLNGISPATWFRTPAP